MMKPNEFYTPKQFAEVVKAHHFTILRQIQAGEIKAENVGGRYFISKAEAKKWIKKHQGDTDGRRLKIDTEL